MRDDFDNARRLFLLRTAGWSFAAALLAPAASASFLSRALGLDSPSVDQQKKVGDQAARETLKQYKQVTDARASHFNDIGQRLVAALPDKDRTTWNFRYHVLDSKEVNAFALPGGNMFMFTGLYEKLTTDDALAAVTGHEMTHVRKQHWAKAYAQSNQHALEILGATVITHAGEAVQDVAGLSDSLYNLKYSRSEEDQADQGGLEDMTAAGFNPEGMIQLFDTLQSLGGDQGPGFLSDHPLTSDRIKKARERIAALGHDHPFPPFTPLDYAALVGR